MTVTPPFLKRGDKIGIISTARKISMQEVACCISIFENQGYQVVLGKNLFSEYNQFAGTDVQRLLDIQEMLDDTSINAIVCARGGYGTVKIIDNIDFSRFIKNPKWIIGYSDVTVLHSHIFANYQILTIHATMPINFSVDGAINNSVQRLLDAISGKSLNYKFNSNPFNKEGIMQGEMVGGNLSILYSLTGTSSQLNTAGKILFIEDLDEYIYHIDRMMMNLKRAGMLENLKGLVVGGMSQMHDNAVPFGKSAEEIISDTVKGYNYPVCFNFPAGHIDENYAFINGGNVKIEIVKDAESTFNQGNNE